MDTTLIPLPVLSLLENNTTKSYTITELTPPVDIILVHHLGKAYAYRDICPHFGVTLNWKPDQYYDYEQRYLQCSTHGALFQIDDGLCIYGPCHGASLKPVELIKKAEHYYVDISQFSVPD